MRQLAQLVDRDARSRRRRRRASAGALAARPSAELVLGVAQREPDRDEPLLGAVVQVALDPPALLVRRPRRCAPARPRPRRAGGAARRAAARSRSPARRPRRPARSSGRGPRRSGACSTRPSGCPSRSIGDPLAPVVRDVGDRQPARVDVELALGQEEAQLEPRVATARSRRTRLDLLGRRPAGAQVLQEVGHPPQRVVAGAVEAAVDRVLHPRAQRPERHRDDERGRRGRPRPSRGRARSRAAGSSPRTPRRA